jgi:nucleotide sugar dehydrogenase
MPSVLNLSPDEMETYEKRSKYTVSVVGCGQNGILYANGFAGAGFRVICTDADQSLTKRLARGKAPFVVPEVEIELKSLIKKGKIFVSLEPEKTIAQSDIVVLSVGSRIDDKKKIDYSSVVNACKQVGSALHSGVFVIYGGIAGLGSIEGIIKEILENTSGLKVGKDIGLAYVPIYSSNYEPIKSINDLELQVAATEKISLKSAVVVLQSIAKSIKQVTDIRTAEIAILFRIAKQDTDMAFANELAVFCENSKTDYCEVSKIVGFKDSSFYPAILEDINKNQAYLLLEGVENLNSKLRLSLLARQINEEFVKHAVNLTQDALRGCGKTLRRSRIAVLGTSCSRTVTDAFISLIETKGAKTSIFDPSSKMVLAELQIVKGSLNEAIEGTDCIVVLTCQEQFKRLNFKKLKNIMKSPAIIIDLVGMFEAKKIETEGFIYRGIGKRERNK